MLRGDQLVFLVSQPRSGSTLLQQLIASHPEVITVPEAWFLLPLVYANRRTGTAAEYNSAMAAIALDDFLSHSGGHASFDRAVSLAARSLYDAAAPGWTGYFLDKTPRYFHIVTDLYRIFPEARFVLLTRSPLAVLSSIIETNGHGAYRTVTLPDRAADVLTGPRRMAEALQNMPAGRAVHVRYEDVIANPSRELEKVHSLLGLEGDGTPPTYGTIDRTTTFVDPKSIHKHDRPVGDYVDTWRDRLQQPSHRAFFHGYLDRIESTAIDLGHDVDALRQAIGPRASAFWTRSSERFWADLDKGAHGLHAAPIADLHQRGLRELAPLLGRALRRLLPRDHMA